MGKPFFTLCVPILQAFHGTTLSRNISITVPHNIEKRCKGLSEQEKGQTLQGLAHPP
ncbi:hypothetical protein PJF56_05730 [Roseofilum sp. BLCC_M91]|uniref:Uncharacterized protein n=1 Tax=Roseofilum halophilum BLCC-M91 TaxID=3022259 RepID=A0ABT7BIN6_9CYAN|nr:hypothetical protein [Roseofilum halophilum]MDJ1178356.1 hypothetical protein [Roseofilum halophilum BLCC-M91]